MVSEIHKIVSSNLSKEVELKFYGHYGAALLLFPALADHVEEYEENGLIQSISHLIKKGKCRVFSIGNVNSKCWLNDSLSNEEKSKRHLEFNNFIMEELLSEIYAHCGGPVPIITCGASMGAYHAANAYFRRPDVFHGVVSMSGFYNIDVLAKGYYDSNCYFNSPVHYLPNLTDNYWLSFLISKKHVYLLSGSGTDENPSATVHFHDILTAKGIPHNLEIWDDKWGHNWNTWNKMLPKIIESRF